MATAKKAAPKKAAKKAAPKKAAKKAAPKKAAKKAAPKKAAKKAAPKKAAKKKWIIHSSHDPTPMLPTKSTNSMYPCHLLPRPRSMP